MEEDEVYRELQALPKHEWDRAVQDLYGQEAAIDETPEMLASLFSELHRALQAFPSEESGAYRVAVEVCPQYVGSDEFILMFLRSTGFDVKVSDKLTRLFC
jgi:hypothetical protein